MKAIHFSIMTIVATVAQAEPLTDFKALVKQCSTAYESKPTSEVVLIERTGRWVKRMYGRAQIAYDVKKTDSLVSPFTAYLTVAQVITGKDAQDEASANNLSLSFDDAGTVISTTTANFRYSGDNGRWVLVDGSSAADFKSKPGPDFDRNPSKVSQSKDSLEKEKSTFSSFCLDKKGAL